MIAQIIIVSLLSIISKVSTKYEIDALSYYQYDCSSMSTKETEINSEKYMEISFICKSQFKSKNLEINMNYKINDYKEKTDDSFLKHLFYINERRGKLCIECLLLENKKEFNVIKENDNSILISKNNKFTINSEEAQLLKVIKINLMEQHIFEDDWNFQFIINKHSIIKTLSQIIFAFLIVLYEF